MKFVPSILILLFSLTYLGIWLLDKSRKHLLVYSASFCSFSVGLLVQIFQFPGDKTLSVLLSSAFYLIGALLFSDGVLKRSNKRYSLQIGGGIACIVYAMLIVLCYLDSSFFYLAAVVNFGIGAIILSGCIQARFLWQGSRIERVFFLVLVGFCLHFFIRTILTVGTLSAIVDPAQLVDTPFWSVMAVTISILSVCVGLCLLVVVTSDVIIELQKERDSDPLTGLLNRRGLDRLMASVTANSYKGGLNVIVADLDDFKRVNDVFGHPVGDQVLTEFAQLLQTVDNHLALSRIGGEEFVVILKGEVNDGWRGAEAIRASVFARQFACLPAGYKVSCSLGITTLRSDEKFWTAFMRADGALITAKRDGRNRVVTEDAEFLNIRLLRS